MKPDIFRRLVKLENVSIKTSIFKITWVEGTYGITAETSFGRCHISKQPVELRVYSPTGNKQIWCNIDSISLLKQKVEEAHITTINKAQMYIHNQIKVK